MSDRPKRVDWQILVEGTGLQIVSKGRLLGTGRCEFAGDFSGIAVVGRGMQSTVRDDNAGITGYHVFIEVRATFPLGGPRLRIKRQGTFRSWLSLYGYQDIEIGVHDLDFHLTIKGNPPAQVAAMLQGAAGELREYLKIDRNFFPSSDRETVLANLGFSSDDAKVGAASLRTTLQMIVKMASCDFYRVSSLRALPGAESAPHKNSPYRVRLRVPSEVYIDAVRAEDGSVAIEASAEDLCQRADKIFSLDQIQAIEEHSEQLGIQQALLATGATTMQWRSGRVLLVWPSIDTEPDSLLRGAALLARIARTQAAQPFR